MGRAHEVRAASMAKTAAAKSKVYSKHGKEIYMAAKNGEPDPDLNPTLKRKIDRAKKEQVPADVIKRAIEKAKGGIGDAYTPARYEGFSHGNALVIADCLTDNVNRTFSDVRTAFAKTGSKLGVNGSVVHMFNNLAMFSFSGKTDEEVLEILVMADCDVEDIEYEDGAVTIYAPLNEYNKISTALTESIPDIKFDIDEITWLPLNYVSLENEDLDKFKRLLQLLEDNEDVQDVYHNVSLA